MNKLIARITVLALVSGVTIAATVAPAAARFMAL
jgi:hypothetical protein